MTTKKTDSTLIVKSREICSQIYAKSKESKINIRESLQFYIHLHISLEVWVNHFMRTVLFDTGPARPFFWEHIHLYEKIRKLSFAEKVDLFSSLSSKPNKKIAWKIKDFCEMRNIILHWEEISIITDYNFSEPQKNVSKLKEKLDDGTISTQVELFKKIIALFIECYNYFPKGLKLDNYENIANEYLSLDFLKD